MTPRLVEAYRVLAPDGTLDVHLDHREGHSCRLLLDALFGEACFLKEVIRVYDYGGRTRRRWPPKHGTILVHMRDPARYVFNADDVDREPSMAPGLVSPEKVALGELPTDVWWHTIVSPTGSREERLPGPAAARRPLPAHPGVIETGRHGAGLLRRLRHDRRRRRRVGPPLHHGRLGG